MVCWVVNSLEYMHLIEIYSQVTIYRKNKFVKNRRLTYNAVQARNYRAFPSSMSKLWHPCRICASLFAFLVYHQRYTLI